MMQAASLLTYFPVCQTLCVLYSMVKRSPSQLSILISWV